MRYRASYTPFAIALLAFGDQCERIDPARP
jgi:hypothetical protein